MYVYKYRQTVTIPTSTHPPSVGHEAKSLKLAQSSQERLLMRWRDLVSLSQALKQKMI